MISFDSLTLYYFLQENSDFFLGGKIQKIQQPSRHELIFFIRSFTETKKFYINFNPVFYHVCFMSKKNEELRNIILPKSALMFCMLLRKYILNAKIIKVDVPKYERIFEIYFEYFDELNEKSQLCLAIELMGKHSNVILYNYDTNVIIGCAHNVSSEKSRERELYGMLPYVYPPKQKKKNLLNISFNSFLKTIETSCDVINLKQCPNTLVPNFDELAKIISSSYYYLTVPIVKEFMCDLMSQSHINHFTLELLYQKLQDFLSKKEKLYCIKNDYSKYFLFNSLFSFNCSNANDMIDRYFAFHQNKFLIANMKTKILKIIQFQLNKLYSLKTKQEIQINRLNNALVYKKKADILMANLYFLKSGMREVVLSDFEGKDIIIDLEETLSPSENANRYYSLYKKTKSAYEHAIVMNKETVSQILFYEEQKFYTQNSDNFYDLQDIYKELNNEESSKENKISVVDFIEYKGIKIYIGKNKKQNDYILSKISSPDDIWFHPLNAPGAHVLIKKNNLKDEISDDILLKAALITKEYSAQKNNSKTCIIYTKRKFVKKANNKIAFVTYKNETEIIV